MNAMNEFLHNHSDKLPPDAVERMLLVTLLHEALSKPLMKIEHLAPGRLEVSEMSERSAEAAIQDVHEMLTSAGIKNDMNAPGIRARVALALAQIDELREAQKTTSSKGWRLPKRGDKVRCVKKYDTDANFIWPEFLRVGDVITVEVLSSCTAPGLPPYEEKEYEADKRNYYNKRLVPCLCFFAPNNDSSQYTSSAPIDCFEPA